MTKKLIWNANKTMEGKPKWIIYKDFCFPGRGVANVKERSLFHKSPSN